MSRAEISRRPILVAALTVASFVPIVGALADPVVTDPEPVIQVVKPIASGDAASSQKEEQEVINVLQTMGKAYARGDIAGYIEHLDDNCSVYDEHKNKMVEGKQAVITALKQIFAKRSEPGADHIVSYTIDQPYVKVTGDTAVVSYRALEVIGGAHARKMQGAMSDVFKKEDGHWMKVHQRAVWKRMK
jgi:ketosteroid isomerase-like protein